MEIILFGLAFFFIYMVIGLVTGRIYYQIELKRWHQLNKSKYKTARQVEQEHKLKEIEHKKALQTRRDEINNQRIAHVTRVDAAATAVQDLKHQRDELITEIKQYGRDFVVRSDLTLGDEMDSLNSRLEIAVKTLKGAKRLLDKHEENVYQWHDDDDWFDHYEARQLRNTTTYERALAAHRKKLNIPTICMVFGWPFMAAWFSLYFGVRGAIRFGDKILHAGGMEKYVSPEELHLEAKLKSLTETDPELAKMYSDLAKSLEA